MKQISLSAKALVVLAIVFLSQGFSNRPGGDYFRVLLNDQLVTEQFLYKAVTIKTVSLASTNNNDKLTVFYSHCGKAGVGRNVTLRTISGKVLGKWDFADSKHIEVQMAVKDILKASAKNKSASLYYASKEIPSGKPLVTIEFSNKATASL
jgi:hypothetical protein